VAILSIVGDYDFRIGLVHLTAHGLFKPLLMMNACFLVALMISGAGFAHHHEPPGASEECRGFSKGQKSLFAVSIVLLVVGIYCTSVTINFAHHDWTHRHISAEISSLHSAWQLFVKPQADGFYRPLTFLSLWLDYRWFATAYAGYHLQSIALHCINSLMVAWLAMSLGLGKRCALWAGFLFAAAAVNFEAVVWPAARFDLLSAMFMLTALNLAIAYFRTSRVWAWTLPTSLLFYVLGLMNKESSYCFPLLLLLLIASHALWSIPKPSRMKSIVYGSLTAAVTALMITIRIAVYGNLGGYPTIGVTESHHFKFGIKTLISLFRAMPLPLFGINTTPAAPAWILPAVFLFAMLAIASALLSRGCFRRREFALLICAGLALAPVMNIIGWLGSPMQHSRYLYIPAIFVLLLLTSTLIKIRRSAYLLSAFLILNTIGAISNIRVYHNALAKIETLARSIQTDWRMRKSTAQKIYLIRIPETPNGVFFFGSELADRVGKKIPSATIIREEAYDPLSAGASGRMIYQWSNKEQTLHLNRGLP
jgi:hypothetical protein